MTPRELAERICRTLRNSGHQAYLVGGCVRDLLLGREPSDYDVATDARPERVLELFPASITVGARFGVILVTEEAVIGEGMSEDGKPGHAQVEVATFRSDIGYSDGRHPDRVEYSQSPEEDVRRRDFTINGLLLDPADRGGARFRWRARGFARWAGARHRRCPRCVFARTSCAWCAPCVSRRASATRSSPPPSRPSKLPRRKLLEVSAERLRDELTKLLTEGAARRAFELLDQTGLLTVLLPEIARMKASSSRRSFIPRATSGFTRA